MSALESSNQPFTSLFERTFDVVVCGSGFVGFSAARHLAAEGKSVLLLEATGALLWEATRAQENCIAGNAGSPNSSGANSIARFRGCEAANVAWQNWLGDLHQRKGANDSYFDVALAEILVAHELATAERVTTLLTAMPVALTHDSNGLIDSVTVASKSGLQLIYGRQWVDATENGLLAEVCSPGYRAFARSPLHSWRSIIMQCPDTAAWSEKLAATFTSADGFELCLSVRSTELRLKWRAASSPLRHQDVLEKIRRIRSEYPDSDELIISHISSHDFPVYESRNESKALPAVPENLLVWSPVYSSDAIQTIQDRFYWGMQAHQNLSVRPMATLSDTRASIRRKLSPTTEEMGVPCDVFVAGTGTAGAIAALAAARIGASVQTVDSAGFPGGVGTGGGITGYFHGVPGGLQEELNELSAEITRLLVKSSSGKSWHHEAKKLAILTLFDGAGVSFTGESILCDVEKNSKGWVESVLVASDGRLVRYIANSFIDSTGDGDLCSMAGAASSTGRRGDGRTLAYSQPAFRVTNTKIGSVVGTHNYDAGWVDATDPEDLTRARLAGTAQYLRDEWTEPDRPVAIAPLLGVRQSRQIETDVQLTLDDLIQQTQFADCIGATKTCLDTHSVDFEFESDEAFFYYWVCRCFRHPLRSQLPYRMLLPQGLQNVWVACRAAGIAVEAAYGLRMQREMQRIGEAAGVAAAMASRSHQPSREVDIDDLKTALRKTKDGSMAADLSEIPAADESIFDDPLATLDEGRPGVHLWQLYQQPEKFAGSVEQRLASIDPHISFYAAAVLALWGNKAAEARLISAVENREDGPASSSVGPFGQSIDIPFWLLSIVLLRCCGTEVCLPVLNEVASQPGNLLNVRTALALTLERLAERVGAMPLLVESLDRLLEDELPETQLPPSRSLWKMLNHEPQIPMRNTWGVDNTQDHSWQVHLVVARTRHALGIQLQPQASGFLRDSRAFVRNAFRPHVFDLKAIDFKKEEVEQSCCRQDASSKLSVSALTTLTA
jgi:hypothetical protein